MVNHSVIALVGQAGAGKTTVAEHLVANHDFIRVRFADVLKDMLRVLGLTGSEIDGGLKEDSSSLLFGKTPRYAMQTLGTEWERDLIHPDIWANSWKQRAVKQLQLSRRVVCDDCRFLNEGRFVRTFHGAKIWEILRKDLPEQMTHVSESERNLIETDRTIKNYGTIGELKTCVDKLLES